MVTLCKSSGGGYSLIFLISTVVNDPLTSTNWELPQVSKWVKRTKYLQILIYSHLPELTWKKLCKWNAWSAVSKQSFKRTKTTKI